MLDKILEPFFGCSQFELLIVLIGLAIRDECLDVASLDLQRQNLTAEKVPQEVLLLSRLDYILLVPGVEDGIAVPECR